MAEMHTEDWKEPDAKALTNGKNDEFEIEIVDDTPPQDRNRKPLNKSVDEIATDDEVENFGAEAKKRISELRRAAHDERRARESAQREHQAAVDYARSVHNDNERLKRYIAQGEETVKQILTGNTAETVKAAKEILKQAYQSGDADKVADATEALHRAQTQADQAARFTPTPLQPKEFVVQTPRAASQDAPIQAPDERSLRWQARNQWFGQPGHEDMTSLALGVHKKLIESGVSPDDDKYYKTIDGRLRQAFPEFYGPQAPESGGQQRTSSVVAPGGRSTPVRKIQLTESQRRLAERLGVSPQHYAAQVAKLQEKGNG